MRHPSSPPLLQTIIIVVVVRPFWLGRREQELLGAEPRVLQSGAARAGVFHSGGDKVSQAKDKTKDIASAANEKGKQVRVVLLMQMGFNCSLHQQQPAAPLDPPPSAHQAVSAAGAKLEHVGKKAQQE